MRFRLVWYDTSEDEKYAADTDRRHEYLGNSHAIWQLWYCLTEKLKCKHVEIFDLEGMLQQPEKGIHGMMEYHP